MRKGFISSKTFWDGDQRVPFIEDEGDGPRLTLENCKSLLLGLREVVMRILGSSIPARSYSSSMCVRGSVGKLNEKGQQ